MSTQSIKKSGEWLDWNPEDFNGFVPDIEQAGQDQDSGISESGEVNSQGLDLSQSMEIDSIGTNSIGTNSIGTNSMETNSMETNSVKTNSMEIEKTTSNKCENVFSKLMATEFLSKKQRNTVSNEIWYRHVIDTAAEYLSAKVAYVRDQELVPNRETMLKFFSIGKEILLAADESPQPESPEKESTRKRLLGQLSGLFAQISNIDEKVSEIQRGVDGYKFGDLAVLRDECFVLSKKFEQLTADIKQLKDPLMEKVLLVEKRARDEIITKLSKETIQALSILGLSTPPQVDEKERIHCGKQISRQQFTTSCRTQWNDVERKYKEARYRLNWLIYCSDSLSEGRGLPYALQYKISFPAKFRSIDF